MWPRLRVVSLFHSDVDYCTALYMYAVAGYDII